MSLGTGALLEVGKNNGEGSTINIPLPADCGDTAARLCFEHIVGPAAHQFQPDIIIVSAGGLVDSLFVSQLDISVLVDGYNLL